MNVLFLCVRMFDEFRDRICVSEFLCMRSHARKRVVEAVVCLGFD